MRATKIEHFLGLGNAADERAREIAPSEQKAQGRDRERFHRSADEGDIAVAATRACGFECTDIEDGFGR